MKDKIINIALGIIIMICVMVSAFNMGVNMGVNSVELPTNKYFWDDDNCFSVNSTVKTQRNLDENDNVFYTVIVTSEHDRQFIELFDDEYATAKEHKDALIMSLQGGIK